MSDKTIQELRAMDAEIAERIFGKKQFFCKENSEYFQTKDSKTWNPTPFFTTDPADSFALLKKCKEKCGCIKMSKALTGMESVFCGEKNDIVYGLGETLELAIAEFALKIFP